MRTILFFDLPTETSSMRKAYAKFVKEIKKIGFIMLQESVYVKLDVDDRAANSTKDKVNRILPGDGFIALLKITEKQFSGMDFLIGESQSDVVSNNERLIEL